MIAAVFVVLALVLVPGLVLGLWMSRCPVCGFYRDPETSGCNCRDTGA